MMKIYSKLFAGSAMLFLASGATAFAQNPGMKSPPFYPSMIQGTPANQSFAFNHTADHAPFTNPVPAAENVREADNARSDHSVVQAGQRNQSSPYSRS